MAHPQHRLLLADATPAHLLAQRLHIRGDPPGNLGVALNVPLLVLLGQLFDPLALLLDGGLLRPHLRRLEDRQLRHENEREEEQEAAQEKLRLARRAERKHLARAEPAGVLGGVRELGHRHRIARPALQKIDAAGEALSQSKTHVGELGRVHQADRSRQPDHRAHDGAQCQQPGEVLRRGGDPLQAVENDEDTAEE